jgi:hypothetical protein
MDVAPDDSFRLIDMRPPPGIGGVQRMRQQIGRSALALALWRRIGLIWNTATLEESLAESARLEQSDPRLAEEVGRVPRATVLGLKRVFGSRLIIVYTPGFFGTHYDSVEPIEQEVLGLCAQNGVACFSTRDAMARERYNHFQLIRGFANTAPGAGHFNAVGHRIVGEEIWRYLSARSWPPT